LTRETFAGRINQDGADWKPTSGKMRVIHIEIWPSKFG